MRGRVSCHLTMSNMPPRRQGWHFRSSSALSTSFFLIPHDGSLAGDERHTSRRLAGRRGRLRCKRVDRAGSSLAPPHSFPPHQSFRRAQILRRLLPVLYTVVSPSSSISRAILTTIPQGLSRLTQPGRDLPLGLPTTAAGPSLGKIDLLVPASFHFLPNVCCSWQSLPLHLSTGRFGCRLPHWQPSVAVLAFCSRLWHGQRALSLRGPAALDVQQCQSGSRCPLLGELTKERVAGFCVRRGISFPSMCCAAVPFCLFASFLKSRNRSMCIVPFGVLDPPALPCLLRPSVQYMSGGDETHCFLRIEYKRRHPRPSITST